MEKWHVIAGYEGWYEVSSLGRVRSLDHRVRHRFATALKRGRVLRQSSTKTGYMRVVLSKGNQKSTKLVHRLVALAFLETTEDESCDVNHIDCNKQNNSLSNLEWCTRAENLRHATLNGRLDAHIASKRAKKLTPEIVLEIRAANANGEGGCRVLARRFGIAFGTAQKILDRRSWKRL